MATIPDVDGDDTTSLATLDRVMGIAMRLLGQGRPGPQRDEPGSRNLVGQVSLSPLLVAPLVAANRSGAVPQPSRV
jgi:hypothetical protein